MPSGCCFLGRGGGNSSNKAGGHGWDGREGRKGGRGKGELRNSLHGAFR